MTRTASTQAWCTTLVVVGALIAAGAASGQVYRTFQIDPSRSHIRFESGEVSARLGLGTYPYAPLMAQPGMGPVPLTGHFVAAISPDLATPGDVTIVPGTTDVRPLQSVIASPGLGALPGSDPASFGLEFHDAFVGVSGELAMRDLVFAIGGSWLVMSNAAGPWGLFGEMPWIQAIGTYDLNTSLGIEESVPLGAVLPDYSFLWSQSSQLSEVSPGVYELTLPYSFTVSSFGIPGPISDLAASATFTGEVVATTDVPEPGLALGLSLGAGLLAGIGRLGGRRR